MRWYAVHTKPGKEFLAAHHLAVQRYELVFPRTMGKRRHGTRWIAVEVPYFHRYLFVGVNEGQRLAPVRSTIGVSDIVSGPQGPIGIPKEVIKRIDDACDPLGYVIQPELKEGDTATLRLVHNVERTEPGAHPKPQRTKPGNINPLDALVAEIARIDGGKSVQVWLNLFSGAATARVPQEKIEGAGVR